MAKDKSKKLAHIPQELEGLEELTLICGGAAILPPEEGFSESLHPADSSIAPGLND